MKEKILRFSWIFVLFATIGLWSCDESSDDGAKSIDSPKIVQSEEILDNPITLSFSWESVSNAAKYMYQLAEVNDSTNKVIVSGTTEDLSVEIASTDEAELMYSKEYVFTLKAVSADGSLMSEPAEVHVTTSGGAIALSIENLTFRSAVLKCTPVDKNMLYQYAQIPVETYTAYDSDMAFIEDYDFGYYKAMSAAMPWIKWYEAMEAGSVKGDDSYETRMLKPGQTYMLYAYGVEFNSDDTENPVSVVTPLIKNIFTTPKWKATSNCTFDAKIEGQDVVVYQPGETYVNVKVEVTPSDNNMRYYVAFVDKKTLEETYKGDFYDFIFDVILSEEQYGGEYFDWATTSMLSSGKAVLDSKDFGWRLYGSTDYKLMVCGVDNNGLVVTEAATLDFTTIAESTTAKKTSLFAKKFMHKKMNQATQDRK